jgi:hypothetical protein
MSHVPEIISAAMIREAFDLPDDAVLIAPEKGNPVVVTVLAVGEHSESRLQAVDPPGNYLG